MSARAKVLGASKTTKALMDLTVTLCGPKALDPVLAAGAEIFYSEIKSNAPSNRQVIDATMAAAQNKRYAAALLAVNKIRPGIHELRDAVVFGLSKYRDNRAYAAINYHAAHHSYWIEGGRFKTSKKACPIPAMWPMKDAVSRAASHANQKMKALLRAKVDSALGRT